MIAEATISQISERSTLSEIASSYFPIKKKGNQYWGCCPFHNERSPSFAINDDKGVYKCWGCGAGGNLFRFVMEMERITFPEAIEFLAGRLGISVERSESGALDQSRKRALAALENASNEFFRNLVGSGGKAIRDYLKGRGFDRKMCEKWDVGYAPSNYELAGGAEALLCAGLVYDNGSNRFKDRIVFGIRSESGALIGFSGRTTVNHPAKYLNTPDTLLFNKGKLLYGLDKAKRAIMDSGFAVVVEGQIDAIKCSESGIENVVAPLGTGFTSSHASTIKRLCDRAVLVFDGDGAGQEASRKAYAVLSSLGVKVDAVMLDNGQDPDAALAGGADLKKMIVGAKSYPMALFATLSLDTMENKEEALQKMGAALSCLDDGIQRDALATEVARKMKVSSSLLKKKILMGGGHRAIATEPVSVQPLTESEVYLIAHLLQCGKDAARPYDWKLVSEQFPNICAIMDSLYEAGNPASVALVLAKLDARVESAVGGITCEDVHDIDIKAIYRSMVEATIKKKREDGAKMVELVPLLDTLKGL